MKPPTPTQMNILEVLTRQDYVVSGHHTNPATNTYPWGTLNALWRKGLVVVSYHPISGRRIAWITPAGKAAVQGLACLTEGCDGCQCGAVQRQPCGHCEDDHDGE